MKQTIQIWISLRRSMSLIYLPVPEKPTGDGLCLLKRFGQCIPATCGVSISPNHLHHGGEKGRFHIKHTSLIIDPWRPLSAFNLPRHARLPRFFAPEDHLIHQMSPHCIMHQWSVLTKNLSSVGGCPHLPRSLWILLLRSVSSGEETANLT